MIEATLKTAGARINQIREYTMVIEDEDEIVMRKRDEDTGQVIKELTIRELFDAYKKRAAYKKGDAESDAFKFESWFSHKFIKGTAMETRLVSLDFRRI